MRGKRELISDLCAATRATWLLDHIPHRPVLMVLNYHRIGDKDATEYDSGLFSCTAQEFDWQIGYLKSRFRMATLDDVRGLLSGAGPLTEPRVLITFDDGYIDNFQLAYLLARPIRRSSRSQISGTGAVAIGPDYRAPKGTAACRRFCPILGMVGPWRAKTRTSSGR